MVCNAHICNSNLGGPISPKRPETVWKEEITSNTFIKLDHLTELREALNEECKVRKINKDNWTNPGVFFSTQQFTQIKTAINNCRKSDKAAEFTYGDSYEAGEPITKSGMIYLRQFVNILQNTCICQCHFDCNCNCNYCTCDCNYCTCNCDYCTCVCNYCTCDCNYCTCNCNYCTCVCNYCTCDCNYCQCHCNYCPCNCAWGCPCACNY